MVSSNDTYARTLICQTNIQVEKGSFGPLKRLRDDQKSSDACAHRKRMTVVLKSMKNPPTDSETGHEDPLLATGYMANVSRMCTGRRSFTTKGGRIGLGPQDVRDGDFICFLGRGKRSIHSSSEIDVEEPRKSTRIPAARRGLRRRSDAMGNTQAKFPRWRTLHFHRRVRSAYLAEKNSSTSDA